MIPTFPTAAIADRQFFHAAPGQGRIGNIVIGLKTNFFPNASIFGKGFSPWAGPGPSSLQSGLFRKAAGVSWSPWRSWFQVNRSKVSRGTSGDHSHSLLKVKTVLKFNLLTLFRTPQLWLLLQFLYQHLIWSCVNHRVSSAGYLKLRVSVTYQCAFTTICGLSSSTTQHIELFLALL